jgi:hypothetical protein
VASLDEALGALSPARCGAVKLSCEVQRVTPVLQPTVFETCRGIIRSYKSNCAYR